MGHAIVIVITATGGNTGPTTYGTTTPCCPFGAGTGGCTVVAGDTGGIYTLSPHSDVTRADVQYLRWCRSPDPDVAAAAIVPSNDTLDIQANLGATAPSARCVCHVPRPWRNLWSAWKRSTVPAFVALGHPRKIC